MNRRKDLVNEIQRGLEEIKNLTSENNVIAKIEELEGFILELKEFNKEIDKTINILIESKEFEEKLKEVMNDGKRRRS